MTNTIDKARRWHGVFPVVQERGMGRELTRPPRLPLVGEERERVLQIIRTAVATLPGESS